MISVAKTLQSVFFRRTAAIVFRHAKDSRCPSRSEPEAGIIRAASEWCALRDQLQSDWLRAVPRSSIQPEVALTKVSASLFASALTAIGRPDRRRLEILRAHYTAPGRAATAAVLAACVGCKGQERDQRMVRETRKTDREC